MPIAHNQIEEIMNIVWDEVPMGGLERILRRLKRTQAYKKNSSFAQTIDRMIKKNKDAFKYKIGGESFDD